MDEQFNCYDEDKMKVMNFIIILFKLFLLILRKLTIMIWSKH